MKRKRKEIVLDQVKAKMTKKAPVINQTKELRIVLD